MVAFIRTECFKYFKKIDLSVVFHRKLRTEARLCQDFTQTESMPGERGPFGVGDPGGRPKQLDGARSCESEARRKRSSTLGNIMQTSPDARVAAASIASLRSMRRCLDRII